MILLFAFIVVPIIEIALLIHVGGLIGTWPTVGLVILTAVVGTALFRAQGFNILMRTQEVMARGEFPAKELFDGICVLIAGVLLLTPGFVTDALGLCLLVPGLRVWVGRALWYMVLKSGHFQMHVGGEYYEAGRNSSRDKVIEGEYTTCPPDSDSPPTEHLKRPDRNDTRR